MKNQAYSKKNVYKNSRRRQLRQDLSVFVRLFPWWVAFALFMGIATTAFIFQWAYNRVVSPPLSYVRAVYAVLNMIGFQVAFTDIPSESRLDIFFVIVPLIGIPLLLLFGARILNILRIFFIRSERGQVWQETLAATQERPIVICGLENHVGYRVASQLLDHRRAVVGIEADPGPLVDELIEQGMPVIFGPLRNEDVLRSAGVGRAPVVLTCMHDDLDNIAAMYHIRALNSRARIVLRLFEDEITEELQSTFGIDAIISRSAIAAQAFSHAATGVQIFETFELEGSDYILAKATLGHASELSGCTLHSLEADQETRILCLYREGKLYVKPAPEAELRAGDTLFFIIDATKLTELSAMMTADEEKSILVCGVGHTGYRIISALLSLGRSVVVLDFEPSLLTHELEKRGVRVIYGDYRQPSVQEEAGIREACAIITCTENDMYNFEALLCARELNPRIRMLMRFFDEELGHYLQEAFGINETFSTSALASPAFVSAALQIHRAQPALYTHEQYFVTRVSVEATSQLVRQPISLLADSDKLLVLAIVREGVIYILPKTDVRFAPGDEFVVLAVQSELRDLASLDRAP